MEGLTATAQYEGIRGNDITVIVQADPDKGDVFDVITVIDGSVVDEQAVKTIEELKENAWVKFTGTGAPAETAGQALEGGKDPEVSPSDYAQFLTVLEPYTFDILVYDGTDSATMQAMASFVKRVSENVGLKCQAVMAGAETSNSEWVISVNNGVKLSDGTELSPQLATWWLGGAGGREPV